MKQESEQFKVEATPVIDLKKTSPSDLWDNEKTEVYLEDEGGSGSAYLLDSEGEYVPISAFPFVIGRGNECDLILNKKGISRKHAEIVFQSGRFVVNDLDSLNGLKVNGYKVARVILEEGDSIRLGEVVLVFSTSKGSKLSGGGEPLKSVDRASIKQVKVKPTAIRMVVYGGIASLIVLGGVTAFILNRSEPNMTAGRVVVAPVPSVSKAPDAGSANVSNAETAQVESEVLAGTETGLDEVTSSGEDIAPPPSIAVGLPTPPTSGSDNHNNKIDKPVAKIQDKGVSHSKPVAQAPPKKQDIQVTPVAKSGVSNSKVHVDRPNNQSFTLSSVDARYVAGNVEALLAEMKLNLSSKTGLDASYRERYEVLMRLNGKFNAGKQAYIEGRKTDAISDWTAFLKDERAVYGPKKSAMASFAATRLSDEFLALGNAAAKANKHHDAYLHWQKSISFADSVAARIALDAANQKSKQLYRQALRLEYVNTERAKELWQQVMEIVPPGTEYHTKASSKLAWYEKWGA